MLPFLKWAGGKRWLFAAGLASRLPPHVRYIEPFLGGGAGFFALAPSRALLSDINPEVVNVYEVVRDYPDQLRELLSRKHGAHSREHYYLERANRPADPVERAARTLYLNRTCWNGLYRLNKKGEFNVPIGTKSSVLLDTDDFEGASDRLRLAEIVCSDFEEIIDRAGPGDLIFADPPYTVKHNMNGFIKYNERLFAWDDQVRLRDALTRAVQRGARAVITNAHHASVLDLYAELGVHEIVERSSVISGSSRGRSETTELVITL